MEPARCGDPRSSSVSTTAEASGLDPPKIRSGVSGERRTSSSPKNLTPASLKPLSREVKPRDFINLRVFASSREILMGICV